MVGMAANLAVNLRGMDVISNGEALEQIAAEELGVESLVFRDVLGLLEEADMATTRQTGRSGFQIEERIPYHQDLYQVLGDLWQESRPADIEYETVALTNALAIAPRELDQIKSEIPSSDLQTILAVGTATQLMKELKLSDGTTLIYSPFFVFENPEVLKEIFESHENADVREIVRAIRGEQGLLVDFANPVLKDMVARGLLMTPTISGAGGDASFAFLPYTVAPEYRGLKKAVLDKAIQILACVRYGEHRGVATKINNPAALLRALSDPARNFTISAHSEHKRQYQTLYRLQIVDFVPSGDWVEVRLLDTDDNKKAVSLALDLLQHGEQISDRGLDENARRYLMAGDRFENPLKTIKDRQGGLHLSSDQWSTLAIALRGGGIL
jgi:hypothetical protein